MKTGIYLCQCGSNIAERVDCAALTAALRQSPGVAFIKPADFLCSEDGKQFLARDLAEERPDRVVIAACSPREYEAAFMEVLAGAGMNPYYLQMVNIREHVAWVTPDPQQAVRKAAAQIRAAAARVRLHDALEPAYLDISTAVVVIGAGPAGLKSALALAAAGREVILVERSPVLGGLPVLYEELFPNMECGPCMLEPLLGEVLHGPHARRIRVLTLAEVVEVLGYFGNFTVKVRQQPRYVDEEACIGCGECVPPCPASRSNEFNRGLDRQNAMAMPFAGALPNLPFLNFSACVRASGEDCTLCRDACPVEGAIRYGDGDRLWEFTAGAIVVATGAGLRDYREVAGLGHGSIPGVYDSLEFERIAASNGPSGNQILAPSNEPPRSVALVHCAGSMDEAVPYCSGVCCSTAFKFHHLLSARLPECTIYHLYRELAVPGKESFHLYRQARANPRATWMRYRGGTVRLARADGPVELAFEDEAATLQTLTADLVVLCSPVTPGEGAGDLARVLDIPRDGFGFFEELHGRVDVARSKVRGIYLAGACQGPMDIQQAMTMGAAAAGHALSELVEGRKLLVEPVTARVDETRCSGCRTCGSVCPYRAISYAAERNTAEVNGLLCHGCGTCVAACPAGALEANHFTSRQIRAEIGELVHD